MSESFESFSFTEWESALGVPSDILADDGRGIHELKISNKLYKKKEEIDAHSVDESLNELDRALFIVRNGQPVQMFSVIHNFSKLVAAFPRRSLDELFPSILTSAPKAVAHAEYQAALCSFLVETIDKLPASSPLLLAVFETARTLSKSDKEVLVQCWSKVYLACVSKGLPRDLMIQIIKVVILEGGFTQPVSCRVWCAKVLGACAHHFSSDDIKSLFLDKAISLCQDTDLEVRSSMGQQLAPFIRAVVPKLVSEKVLPEYLELVMDEELAVRQSAIGGLGQVLDHLGDDNKRTHIVPAWLTLIRDECLTKLLSKEFGCFFWHCKCVMTDHDMQACLVFYLDLAHSNDPDVRINCIYNMPAMVKSLGPDTKLLSILERLSSDPHPSVRLKVATCLPVLMDLLPGCSYQLLRPTFFSLFADGDVVFPTMLASLDVFVQRFLGDDAFRKGTDMNDFLFILFRRLREVITRGKWSLAHQFLEQLRKFAGDFDPDQVYDVCVPVLMRIISESQRAPLSELSVMILLDQVRRFQRLEQRDNVCRSLVSDLAFSSSHRSRLLYVTVCEETLHRYSSRFFRQYFAHAFLSLSTDSVIGVKRKMVKLLPIAAAAIMAASVPLGSPLPVATAASACMPASDHSASASSNTRDSSAVSSSGAICSLNLTAGLSNTNLATTTSPPASSDEALVKKLTVAVETLTTAGFKLYDVLISPPVGTDAATRDHEREVEEEHSIREDMEDTRRKMDVISVDVRRGPAGAGIGNAFAADAKDRKKVGGVVKNAKGGVGGGVGAVKEVAALSKAGGTPGLKSSGSGLVLGSTSSAPMSTAGGQQQSGSSQSATHLPGYMQSTIASSNSAGSTGTSPALGHITGARRPRLRSANSALPCKDGEMDHPGVPLNNLGTITGSSAAVATKSKSISNGTLSSGTHVSPTQSSAAIPPSASTHKTIGSGVSASSAGGGNSISGQRRPSDVRQDMLPSSSVHHPHASVSSAKKDKGGVKLPALSKSAVGR